MFKECKEKTLKNNVTVLWGALGCLHISWLASISQHLEIVNPFKVSSVSISWSLFSNTSFWGSLFAITMRLDKGEIQPLILAIFFAPVHLLSLFLQSCPSLSDKLPLVELASRPSHMYLHNSCSCKQTKPHVSPQFLFSRFSFQSGIQG